MTMREFIRANRSDIDKAIRSQVDNSRINDEERRIWILNDEGLYNWARSEGVRI